MPRARVSHQSVTVRLSITDSDANRNPSQTPSQAHARELFFFSITVRLHDGHQHARACRALVSVKIRPMRHRSKRCVLRVTLLLGESMTLGESTYMYMYELKEKVRKRLLKFSSTCTVQVLRLHYGMVPLASH